MADSGESHWIERAQSAEARLQTLRANQEATLGRVQQFKTNFGIRERSDGVIDIDFDKFAAGLGAESCLELRRIIDEMYHISGEVDKKPRIRKRLPKHVSANGTG